MTRTRKLTVCAFMVLVLAGLPAGASAASAPPCDPQVYPSAYLRIDGSVAVGKTRYVRLRVNEPGADSLQGQADPEYPFPLNVAPSNGASRRYTVRDFAKDEFPVRFSTGETDRLTATYVEVHTSYAPGIAPINTGVPVDTRCSRTISTRLREPGGSRGHRHHSEPEDRPDR
jgi:hypothetical protein